MKKALLIFLLLVTANNLKAQTATEAISATVKTFFEGMHARDTLKIKSVCDKDLILKSVYFKADKSTSVKNEEFEGFLKSVKSIPETITFEERLLEIKVQNDELVATAFTPYEFYLNQKLSHKGTNIFILGKIDGTWKILGITDSRIKWFYIRTKLSKKYFSI